MNDLEEAIFRQVATMTSEEILQQFKKLFGREMNTAERDILLGDLMTFRGSRLGTSRR